MLTNQYDTVTGHDYYYDAAGNMVEDVDYENYNALKSYVYSYDYENRLMKITLIDYSEEMAGGRLSGSAGGPCLSAAGGAAATQVGDQQLQKQQARVAAIRNMIRQARLNERSQQQAVRGIRRIGGIQPDSWGDPPQPRVRVLFEYTYDALGRKIEKRQYIYEVAPAEETVSNTPMSMTCPAVDDGSGGTPADEASPGPLAKASRLTGASSGAAPDPVITTTRYYYNSDWQVLTETDEYGDLRNWWKERRQRNKNGMGNPVAHTIRLPNFMK